MGNGCKCRWNSTVRSANLSNLKEMMQCHRASETRTKCPHRWMALGTPATRPLSPKLALQESSARQPAQQAFQHTLQGLMITDPSDCATLPPPQLSEELKITVWGGAPEPLSCVVWRWQAARAKQADGGLPATSSPGSRKPKALGEATQPRPSQENGPRP